MPTTSEFRTKAVFDATNRPERKIEPLIDNSGRPQSVSDYFGANLFDFRTAEGIPDEVRKELIEVSKSGKPLNRDHVEVVAIAATEWAKSKGATHFCHWFHPLTGNTAQKHDAFLNIKNGKPIEKISVSQLIQGEPDASSFPNGGSRSTFEARGYTAWDISSPMFLLNGINGKTLCIPTAFVSYHGQALDTKTPLLRSISRLSDEATKFLNLTGKKDTKNVNVTCGSEQEYFLVDKAFVAGRSDLTMTGRTLLGSLPARNQQLCDHYFGDIPDRVISFMQELDRELYLLGIPSKTRHNEVAPAQFEIAPIFTDGNIAGDQNQVMMATVKSVARKHNFEALLHEKPFAGVNGSGKHLNWSMSSSDGENLLEPGDSPEDNLRFLSTVSVIVEAVHRRAKSLRMAIASHGNDHRLGANEAPPSIISVFLGDTIERIFTAIMDGKKFESDGQNNLDLGANQLANLAKDNTDRNRTSPFAFTGNKFEFRAVGSSHSISFPMTFLNAAVAEVLAETNTFLEAELSAGKSIDDALNAVIKKWLKSSSSVIFNGDGYSQDWVKEAESRGLPNLRTTADALPVLNDTTENSFVMESGVLSADELQTRFNVLIEKYVLAREIEFETLISLVQQNVIPSAINYKMTLSDAIKKLKEVGIEASGEKELLKKINFATEKLFAQVGNLENGVNSWTDDYGAVSKSIASSQLAISEEIADICNELEEIIPDDLWTLPKYREMLFIR